MTRTTRRGITRSTRIYFLIHFYFFFFNISIQEDYHSWKQKKTGRDDVGKKKTNEIGNENKFVLEKVFSMATFSLRVLGSTLKLNTKNQGLGKTLTGFPIGTLTFRNNVSAICNICHDMLIFFSVVFAIKSYARTKSINYSV